MSSSVRTLLPYSHLMDPNRGNPLMAKVQALVSSDDKRTVLAALGGDDGVLTLTIQFAFKHTADYIRSHGLNHYDPSNYDRVLAFICNGPDSHPSLHTPSHPLPGGTESRQPTPPSTPSEPTTRREGRAGRIRERAKVLRAQDPKG